MSGNNTMTADTLRSGNIHNRNSQRSTLLKVVILGDGGVGKSCLMNRFVSNRFDEYNFYTIGVEFLNKDIEINGESYTLQIWDTAGQERFKTLRTPFYRGSDICLLTYAVDDRTSFKNLALWRSEFLYYADVEEASTFPFIVVGNKVDVLESEKQVTTEEARAWCAENGDPPLVETSAKDATNVEAAFAAAVAAWARLEARLEHPLVEDTVDLSKQLSPQRSSCCMPVSGAEIYICDQLTEMGGMKIDMIRNIYDTNQHFWKEHLEFVCIWKEHNASQIELIPKMVFTIFRMYKDIVPKDV